MSAAYLDHNKRLWLVELKDGQQPDQQRHRDIVARRGQLFARWLSSILTLREHKHIRQRLRPDADHLRLVRVGRGAPLGEPHPSVHNCECRSHLDHIHWHLLGPLDQELQQPEHGRASLGNEREYTPHKLGLVLAADHTAPARLRQLQQFHTREETDDSVQGDGHGRGASHGERSGRELRAHP
jgi:hypothetical protein